MRSRSVVLGAALLLSLSACDNRAEAAKEGEALPPVGLAEEPAASAGGACILWDYAFIKSKIGVTFDVAASGQADETSTCVVQTVGQDWPDLALSVVESTQAGAALFLSDLKPKNAATLKGLGLAAYRLNTAASGGHGPTVEIGWLSEAKQLQTLRFTFAKDAKAADVTAMNNNLLTLAKAMDTTNG
ncbi:hypothetical protein [Actinoplanes subtropicus]|uniref:hypothetical protein n=1 Tax=Actinoplanes subtropicus TaxID=543632 RepID=UPI0004C46F32|nr:hypothetical protein [Actinoplanes subtropicus]